MKKKSGAKQKAVRKALNPKGKRAQPAVINRRAGRKAALRRSKQEGFETSSLKTSWPQAPTHPEAVSRREVEVISELPFSYGETKLVLMVRDPYWAYSYWDFSGETWTWCQRKFSEDSSLKPIMRVHDLDAKRHYDLLVSLEAKNWYLHLGTPDHRYTAELGIGDGKSKFYLIARSNEVRTPRNAPSEVVDPEWKDRDFDELYRLSGGGRPGTGSPGSIYLPPKS